MKNELLVSYFVIFLFNIINIIKRKINLIILHFIHHKLLFLSPTIALLLKIKHISLFQNHIQYLLHIHLLPQRIQSISSLQPISITTLRINSLKFLFSIIIIVISPYLCKISIIIPNIPNLTHFPTHSSLRSRRLITLRNSGSSFFNFTYFQIIIRTRISTPR